MECVGDLAPVEKKTRDDQAVFSTERRFAVTYRVEEVGAVPADSLRRTMMVLNNPI